jgi:hypothetical protein
VLRLRAHHALLLLAAVAGGCGSPSRGEVPAASRTFFEPVRPRTAAPHASLDGLFLTAPSAPAFAPEPSVAPFAAARRSVCNEQPPQEHLVRGSYLVQPGMSLDEKERRRTLHRAAIEYRSREYGLVEGYGEPSWNHLQPKHYARSGKFFGLPIRMNNRVLTALGCVEEIIRETCADAPYVPEVLDGLRGKNTFHNDEVSNHLYGIAIDIDPNKNSCCGCVPPLSEWPRCKVPVASPFERTFIPRCWVDAFERYGFYWLGHDVLEDTMHFEFLGDPDRILTESK